MFFFRTLPAKHVDKIAVQVRQHNINALLIIGGFEVCRCQLLSSNSLFQNSITGSDRHINSATPLTSIWLQSFIVSDTELKQCCIR